MLIDFATKVLLTRNELIRDALKYVEIVRRIFFWGLYIFTINRQLRKTIQIQIRNFESCRNNFTKYDT